jgi:hypothetical protein
MKLMTEGHGDISICSLFSVGSFSGTDIEEINAR